MKPSKQSIIRTIQTDLDSLVVDMEPKERIPYQLGYLQGFLAKVFQSSPVDYAIWIEAIENEWKKRNS